MPTLQGVPSHSRSRTSRNRTSSLGPYVPQAEGLILPDGAVGEMTTELLNELVHHHSENTPISEDTGASDADPSKLKPSWWRRPSPWWLLGIVPFTSIAMSATLAPRVEIYTTLACSVHKPDIFRQAFPALGNMLFSYDAIPSIIPPTANYTSSVGMIFLDHSGLQDITGDQPSRPNLCASDPVVQAAVAKLSAVISACMGILSCLTTGWWGSFSDRHGRTRVMGISIIGLLLTDFNFIITTLNIKRIPGGYWFLVVGPLIEGSLGGMTSAVAAMHAYVADTTTEENRSRMFSLSLGLLFTGMALGPTLGGLLIRFTGKTLSVFYVATALHFIYACLVWLIIPESLTATQMHKSAVKYDGELRETAHDREINPAVGLLVRIKRLFAFLSPLTVFMPEIVENGANPLKKKKRDWNLTLIAAGYAFTISLMGSYTYKFQYAASAFGWTSEKIGYWLSLVGAVRAVFLTVVLPIAIKVLKPKPTIIEIQIPAESTETQPLLTPASSDTPGDSSSAPTRTVRKEIHSPAFDLGLAQASLFVEVIAYLFIALLSTPLAFTLFSVLAAAGTGFSPAVQCVALAMYTRRGGTESGRLFGALSVVQALSSQILGPALYGLVYMKTVATFPRAIFFVSVGTIAISFVLLSFVRLPKDDRESLSTDVEETESSALAQEATLVDVSEAEEEQRGRSHIRKISASSV